MTSLHAGVDKYGTFSGDARDLEKQRGVEGGGGALIVEPGALWESGKLVLLFVLWYVLNVLYNIDNKLALNMLPLPWTVSCLQLVTGWAFFGLAWVTRLRPMPTCHSVSLFMTSVFPQGIFHLFVHVGAIISMSGSAVAFTHIVKAGEPVITALLSCILLGQIFSWQTYLSLFPVVFGVALASLKELSFTWFSFWCAMLSNLGSSCRSIFAKKMMSDKSRVGTNLTSSNMFSLLTIVATLVCIPLVFLAEGGIMMSTWADATRPDSPYTSTQIASKILVSGVWYYLYNEVAFGALEKVNQVTHAVANTLKRVFIIVTSIIVFQTPVTNLGAAGSAVAIGGTLLYSMSVTKYG